MFASHQPLAAMENVLVPSGQLNISGLLHLGLNLGTSDNFAYFISFAHEMIRPTNTTVGSVQEIGSSHPMTVNKDQRQRLGDSLRNKMFDVHLAVRYIRRVLRNVLPASVEILAPMKNSWQSGKSSSTPQKPERHGEKD